MSDGNSTIMSLRECEDFAKVIEYVRTLPDVDTSKISIVGGSQAGLHGLWAI